MHRRDLGEIFVSFPLFRFVVSNSIKILNRLTRFLVLFFHFYNYIKSLFETRRLRLLLQHLKWCQLCTLLPHLLLFLVCVAGQIDRESFRCRYWVKWFVWSNFCRHSLTSIFTYR